MTPERWKRVEEVFQAALDLPAGERQGFVAEACAGDAELRAQVAALVEQYESAGDFIEEPAAALTGLRGRGGGDAVTNPVTGGFVDPALGRRIGAYRIAREIGRGGMGAVYLAERADSEFRRRVAIKLIKRGMDTDFILRRFRNERQILATLDHPYIARLLDGGTTDDGLPYFVMEYIEGLPVYRFCDEQKLTTPERLRLFRHVCDAVHYAHRQLVIHRDIKPSNILVTAEGTPKLLDFGIAKLLNPDLAAEITIDPTATAMRLMTPEYAAPEQVVGEPVTPATDVYALGVLLYELLTGHRPYRVRHRSPDEMARVVREQEPVLPSERVNSPEDLLPAHPAAGADPDTLSYLYWSRNATAESLRRELSGALDQIVMKALRKAPRERYASAEELRDDITRHLDGRPVSAPPVAAAPPRPPARARRDPPRAAGPEPPPEELSIAVLPLKMLDTGRGGETGDDSYLGVGLADALITRLGSLRRFALRPTSSVLRFGEADTDPFDAGRQLGVSFVLDGRIRHAGDRIRVNVQLLDVGAGSAVWAGQFDQKFTDVLALEDAISEQVAGALVPQLTGGERLRLQKRATESAEAHEAYMRGRYHWNSFTEEGLAKALTHFHEAVALDPNYALAYAGIADYFNWLGVYSVLPFAETSAAAKEAALKAVTLDPALAEGHSALGFARLTHDFEWGPSEADHRRALELNPNYATGRVWYGFQLIMEGRFEEAGAEVRRALELDPLSAINAHALTWCYYNWRRYDEAIPLARRLIALEPRNGIGHLFLGHILAMSGEREESISESLRAVGIFGRTPYALSWLAMAYGRLGRHEEARDVLAEVESMAERRHVSPYLLALAYCNLGERGRALELLEQACRTRDAWLVWMGVEPQLDPVRTDPRFTELLRRTRNPAAGRHATPARRRREDDDAPAQRSIAVLPLRLVSPSSASGTGEEYLGVGLADALITRLSNIRQIAVRPTSSVLRYQGGDLDPLAAGRELDVDYVVAGTVRVAGERIRVSAQLLAVADGETRWAGNFDEKYADVLQLEDSISGQVADSIIPQLTTEERLRLGKRGTDNAEAYESYLRGRYHWNSFTEEGFAKALVCYNRAIALDPDYALAHAGVADYYNLLGVYAVLPFAETSAAAKESALKAVALDPALAEGYAALGFAVLCHDFDWDGAERHLRHALELNPNYPTGRLWYGYVLGLSGRHDEALAHMHRFLQLDTLTPVGYNSRAWVNFYARRYDESLAAARDLARREPDYGVGQVFLCLVLTQTGHYDEAVEAGRRAIELLGRSPYSLVWLASAHAAAGRREEAHALLAEIREMSAARHVSPYLLAMVYCNLGERERAVMELERACEARDSRLIWLGVDPQFDPIRTDPRVGELLRRTHNPLAPPRHLLQPAETAYGSGSRDGGGGRATGDLSGAKSVAVLPLKVFATGGAADSADEYLGVGLADALVTRLSSVQRIVVRPTSSVLRYRSGDADPLAAGRELDVDYVVDGNVRRLGDRIRVTAQLLDVREGATRWAGRFDKSAADVLQLEDSISELVAEALVPRLTGDERRQLEKRGTDSPAAYEAYLRGRFHWNIFTEEAFAQALEYYNRAIQIDPAYALAHAAIADYYNFVGVLCMMPFAEATAAARASALRALELDSTLAEAYSALGLASVCYDFDWAGAETNHQRSIELNPNNATGHQWYSFYLQMAGRFDEAVAEMHRAQEIDPLSSLIMHSLAWCFYHARRFDEALAAYRNLVKAVPNYPYGLVTYSEALRHVGRHEEAVAAAERAVELTRGAPFYLTFLAAALAAAGRREEARDALRRLEEMSRAGRYVSPYMLSFVHVRLGERERALELLEKAYEIVDGWLVWMGVDPELDPLRGDPRFDSLLRRTENPAAARLKRGRPGRRAEETTGGGRDTGATSAQGAPAPPVRPRMTDDDEAQQLYVAGRYYATRRTAEGLRQAIERLERAVERDPQFALAHAELADCYALLNWYVEPPPADAWDEALRYALRAVEVDDSLAEAHASLGFIKLHYERDWPGAETELRRAIELRPDNPAARRWYAFTLAAMGRHDEAVAEIEQARELSPRSPVIATAVANVLFLARRFDEAVEQCGRALELDPGSVAAHVILRWSYEHSGLAEEALATFEQERVFAGDTPTTRAKRAHVLAATGRGDEAREILRGLLANRAEQRVTAYELAVICSLLNERDQAFEFLAEAEREHAVGYTFVRVDPHLDNLRSDPRFAALLQRTGNLAPSAPPE